MARTPRERLAYVRRLAVATGVFGGLLVMLGVALSLAVHQRSVPDARTLTSIFLGAFSLPGALLVAAAGPMHRLRRWGFWLAQLTGAFLVTVFGVQAWRTFRAGDGGPSYDLTIWLILTLSMTTLVGYLVHGGWWAMRLNRVLRSTGGSLADDKPEKKKSRGRDADKN